MNELTIDSLLDDVKRLVEGNIDVSVAQWLDLAAKLNVLSMTLDSDLIKAEMEVNRRRAILVSAGDTNSKADTLIKAMPVYETYLNLKLKRDRVAEQIMIAKRRTQIEPWNR